MTVTQIKDKLVAFLNSINTHHVFGVGVGTAVASITLLAAQPALDAWASDLGHWYGPVIHAWIDVAAACAKASLPASILVAGFGRPPQIPPGPVQPPASMVGK